MKESASNHTDTLDNISYSLVKEAFETGEEFSKKELAVLTQLPVKVVSQLIDRMIESGEIKKQGFDRFAINKNHLHFLCIKIEPEKVERIIFDATYSIVDRADRAGVEKFDKTVDEVVAEVCKSYKLGCIAVSVQCAAKDGIIYKDGAAAFNLQAYLEQKYSVPAVVEKEINLACFGEICGHEMQFLDDEYTACLRLSNSGVQCSLVYKTNVLTGFQGKAGASATANLIGNTKAGQEEAVLRAVKAVNSFFNPKTIIIYKDNADKAETENLKSCEAQNIVFAADYEAKCEKGFVYLIKKRTAVFSW